MWVKLWAILWIVHGIHPRPPLRFRVGRAGVLSGGKRRLQRSSRVGRTPIEETIAMDPHRFDSWTRALAAGLPRRTALKALLGVTLASGAARAAVRDVDAAGNFGDFCGAHDPCNSPLVCINT